MKTINYFGFTITTGFIAWFAPHMFRWPEWSSAAIVVVMCVVWVVFQTMGKEQK